MNKYKVYVYAIAKNEAKHAKDWAKNMSEADGIFVLLDPTSTDNTKEILIKNGVKVKEKLIRPWRFDKARNESLRLVPKDADICVCTDLDERFNVGWRKELESQWQPNTNQAVYKFWHNAGTPNDPPNIFDYSKIHDRNTFKWKWVVHEYIVQKNPNKKLNVVHLNNVMLYHYPDGGKVRSYKKLLEQAVKHNKHDIRYLTLLAEEYVNANEFDNALKILTLLKNNKEAMLNMSDFCLTYKLLIRLYSNNNNFKKAKQLCYYALSKCDYCRIFYGELGQIQILNETDYNLGIENLKKCLTIANDVISAREIEWKDKAKIYNLISIAYWNLKDYLNAVLYVDLALKENPNEQAYLNNKQLYEDEIEKLGLNNFNV